MIRGSKQSLEELKKSGKIEQELCPICFTNEVEDMNEAESALDMSNTVIF